MVRLLEHRSGPPRGWESYTGFGQGPNRRERKKGGDVKGKRSDFIGFHAEERLHAPGALAGGR